MLRAERKEAFGLIPLHRKSGPRILEPREPHGDLPSPPACSSPFVPSLLCDDWRAKDPTIAHIMSQDGDSCKSDTIDLALPVAYITPFSVRLVEHTSKRPP